MKIEHLEDEEDLFRKSIIKKTKQVSENEGKAVNADDIAVRDRYQISEPTDDIEILQKQTDGATRQKINNLWEGLELSLLRYVYFVLKQHGLVQNGQDFSRMWCGKNANWFSYQTTKGRTFSLDAAINCLLELRQYIKHQADLPEEYHKAIDELADLITQFLAIKYRVNALSDCPK